MPTSNKLDDLHPQLQRVYTEAKFAFIKEHPEAPAPRLGETHRPMNVQAAYYAQGRQPLAEINRLRQVAGLYLIGPKEGATIITNAKPGQSAHQRLPSYAFDVMFVHDNGETDWSEGNFILFATYVKAAALKFGIGISQGIYWHFKDSPHTELNGWKLVAPV